MACAFPRGFFDDRATRTVLDDVVRCLKLYCPKFLEQPTGDRFAMAVTPVEFAEVRTTCGYPAEADKTATTVWAERQDRTCQAIRITYGCGFCHIRHVIAAKAHLRVNSGPASRRPASRSRPRRRVAPDGQTQPTSDGSITFRRQSDMLPSEFKLIRFRSDAGFE